MISVDVVTQDIGPHIFQTCPSANYFDCKAMSIGARSQSARTYLERCMEKFSDCELVSFQNHQAKSFVNCRSISLCCQTFVNVLFLVMLSGNLNDLVQHGLRALRETLPAEQDLTTKVPFPFLILSAYV